jgi:5-keto-L-gluconate epimerase
VLEAINRYETNCLNTADQTLELIKKTGNRSIKVHLDTFHMNIEETNIAESIIRCGASLGHMLFADSNRHYPGAEHIDLGGG